MKKTMTGKTDSYCNQKFWWLNVDLTRKQHYSCCAATPVDIDVKWLSKNSGQLFNTPLLQQERHAMLNNEPVASCYDTCIKAESQGLVSRRQFEQGIVKTHTNVNAEPTLVNIVLGSTCNLTCVYCCKQYSSAWLRDVEEFGPYFDTNRFKIFPNDKIKKQFDIQADTDYKLLLDELGTLSPTTIHVSGGEPFLYNNIVDLIQTLNATEIRINTGLGVDPVRFKNQIDKIKNLTNVEILVSGETINQLYELVRYGNTFSKFETNLETVKQSGMKYRFVGVISNLTVLGIKDFYNQYQDANFYFTLCNDPDFLAVNVLDDNTKSVIMQDIQNSNHPAKSVILENISKPVSQAQHRDFSKYILEFTSRRNLTIDLLPDSLQRWIHDA